MTCRSPEAARQARYRRRQNRGLAVVAVETDLHRLVDYLIDAGLLTEIEARDFENVRAATAALIKTVTHNAYPADIAAKMPKRHLED
jgi:hypothetical protein